MSTEVNTTITVPKIFILVALICFLLAAASFKIDVPLVPLGLASWAVAALLS